MTDADLDDSTAPSPQLERQVGTDAATVAGEIQLRQHLGANRLEAAVDVSQSQVEVARRGCVPKPAENSPAERVAATEAVAENRVSAVQRGQHPWQLGGVELAVAVQQRDHVHLEPQRVPKAGPYRRAVPEVRVVPERMYPRVGGAQLFEN